MSTRNTWQLRTNSECYKKRAGCCGPLKSVTHPVFYCLSRIITNVYHEFYRSRPLFWFAHSNGISRKNGMSCDQGLTDLLEAKGMDNIEKISSSFDVLLDAYSATRNANVTRAHTSHVDTFSNLFQRCDLIEWRNEDLQELGTRIWQFKAETWKTFSQY